MITKEKILEIAYEELTPIGWHEEHGKYIDGLEYFAERLVELCNLHIVSVPKGTVCRHCKAENVKLVNGLCYGCFCMIP